jgi:hypothetical protein
VLRTIAQVLFEVRLSESFRQFRSFPIVPWVEAVLPLLLGAVAIIIGAVTEGKRGKPYSLLLVALIVLPVVGLLYEIALLRAICWMAPGGGGGACELATYIPAIALLTGAGLMATGGVMKVPDRD